MSSNRKWVELSPEQGEIGKMALSRALITLVQFSTHQYTTKQCVRCSRACWRYYSIERYRRACGGGVGIWGVGIQERIREAHGSVCNVQQSFAGYRRLCMRYGSSGKARWRYRGACGWGCRRSNCQESVVLIVALSIALLAGKRLFGFFTAFHPRRHYMQIATFTDEMRTCSAKNSDTQMSNVETPESKTFVVKVYLLQLHCYTHHSHLTVVRHGAAPQLSKASLYAGHRYS